MQPILRPTRHRSTEVNPPLLFPLGRAWMQANQYPTITSAAATHTSARADTFPLVPSPVRSRRRGLVTFGGVSSIKRLCCTFNLFHGGENGHPIRVLGFACALRAEPFSLGHLGKRRSKALEMIRLVALISEPEVSHRSGRSSLGLERTFSHSSGLLFFSSLPHTIQSSGETTSKGHRSRSELLLLG